MQDRKHSTDRSSVISATWIFISLNYLFANIFKLLGGVVPKTVEEMERVSSMATPESFFFAAIYLEMAMVMIILSRLLNYRINRWMNILIASLHACGTIASLFLVTPPAFYVFFVAVEVLALIYIIWYAWSWKKELYL